MLDEHALRTLLEDMKRDGVPINGFLDRSSISITGQNITVGVCHGTKFLQEMGFEELLAKRIAEHTGVTPKVTLQSAVTAAEQQQMEEKLERKIAPPVVKFEKKIPHRPSRWRDSTLRTSRSPSSTAKCLPPKTLRLSRIWAARAASA